MLKDIPADVWKVAAVSIPILMGLGAPFLLAVVNVAICIYSAKTAPLLEVFKK
ncbi:hypothetical protein FDJ19_gp124 [Vibrio phage Ceto]|uniref:Uncharacterized protein n=1 Tax=Vibrio phage Ceto TaxID=2570300 RepID=A0A2H5BGR7_9CAUD|nr:hypothetical protein FDJ19_gp124 [Vibrio phage Ceto]AUG85174.1 hypothetical protein CETO_192 [Vibrio phage Ceto]